jgi:tRNA pseudouridine38-40 synthase
VQEAIERAVLAVTGETVTMHSAGRTDSGVHALAMVSHVDIEKKLTPFRLKEALNAKLRPDPIAVIACDPKPADWHARFSCIGRQYEYRIANRREPLTLERGHAWQVTPPARCRRDAARGAAPRRTARFHHLPLGRLPGQGPGQDARPARRAPRR